MRLVDGGTVSLAAASIDARIDAIAGRQRGRVARRQLLAAGIDRRAIDRRIASGRLITIHRGVFAVRPVSAEALAAETAAILVCGERSLIAGHSANVIWGMRKGVAKPVHVVVPRDRRGPKPDGVRVHRSRSLTQADTTFQEGLPITTPARTILDVAAGLPDADVQRSVAEGFALRLLSFETLNAVLNRAPHHPGAPTLRRVIAAGEPKRTTTLGEFKLLQQIREAGLPEPQTQTWVLDYQLDFYYPDLKLAIEVDGPWHETPWAREKDAKRDARLKREKRIDTLRIDPDLLDTDKLRVNAQVVAALTRAQATRDAAE